MARNVTCFSSFLLACFKSSVCLSCIVSSFISGVLDFKLLSIQLFAYFCRLTFLVIFPKKNSSFFWKLSKPRIIYASLNGEILQLLIPFLIFDLVKFSKFIFWELSKTLSISFVKVFLTNWLVAASSGK